MTTTKKALICSICNEEIGVEFGGWAGGHNAEPINNGRCCRDCNDMTVIPERIRRMAIEKTAKR